MDPPPTSEPEIHQPVALDQKVGITESKRRKKEEKVVITARIEKGGVKQKGNGNPGDSWSWRKYGQKPIKGSPYPRGYYRCSTAKGCPAKKQVERSRTDASTLIITYSSSHNHAGPEFVHPNSEAQPPVPSGLPEDKPAEEGGDKFHCAGAVPTGGGESLECPGGVMATLSAEGQLLGGVGGDRDGDDFFDELGELPLSLLCSRSNFFDERMLLLQVPVEHRNGWG